MKSADEVITTMIEESTKSKEQMKETMVKTLQKSTDLIQKEFDDDSSSSTVLALFSIVLIMLVCVLRKFRQVEKRHIL